MFPNCIGACVDHMQSLIPASEVRRDGDCEARGPGAWEEFSELSLLVLVGLRDGVEAATVGRGSSADWTRLISAARCAWRRR
ncbi:hypothetical protein ACP70R_047204 [Stipagrostis hirtigluma subsp. patula]